MATQIRLEQLTGSIGTGSGQVNDATSAAAGSAVAAGGLHDILSHMASAIKRIHGDSSFSEAAAGTFSQDLVPDSDGSRDLGSTSAEWAEVHANKLESQAALDIDSGAAMTLDSAAGMSLDAAGASNFSTSDGTLTIEAGGSDDKLVLKGDHESDVAIHLDGNAASASIVDIDAGVLDVDAAGAITMDAGAGMSLDAAGASNLTTSSGALTLDGAGGVSIAGNSSEVDITTTGAVDVNGAAITVDASAGLSLDSAADSNFSMAANSSSAATMTIAASNSGSGAGVIDMDADGAITVDAGAGLSLQGGAASDITTGAGALTVSGAGGLNLAGGGSEIDVTSAGAALDVNVGSVDMDATAGVAIDGADDMNFTMAANASSGKTLTIAASNSGSGAGAIDMDADGAITVDAGAGLSLDAGAASNLTTSSGALTVSGAGGLNLAGGGSEIDITSASAALDVNMGSVDMDATGAVAIDAASASNFTVAGANLTLSTTTSGNLVASAAGNVDVDGADVTVDATGSLSLDAADDTNLSMAANSSSDKTMTLAASNSGSGAGNMLLSADTVTINGNLDVNGTTTTIDTTSVAVSDHNIVLDRDNSTSGVVDGCGFTMEGGSGDDITLQQLASGDRLELKKGSSYHPLAVGKLMLDSANDHVDVISDVLTLTAATSFEVASAGDVVFDIASGDVVIDSTTAKLEFGSAGSGEHLTGDGTDLTVASGGKINLTATSDVVIPANVGLILDGSGDEKIESDGTDISFSVGSDGDINIPANIGLTFGDDGEKIEGDGTDLTVSGNNIKLTAVADVVIPANVGLVLDGSGDEKIESDGTDITISVGSGGDVNLPANVGLTFGDDGEKIEGDGTDLTIASSGLLNLTATSDVVIPANVGLILDGSGAEKIESDGTDISFSVGSGGDINIPADIGLTFGDDGEKIEGDGTKLTIASSADVVINPGSGKGLIPSGDNSFNLGQVSAGSQANAYPNQSSSPYGVSTAADGTALGTIGESTSTLYLSNSSISSSFFDVLTAGSSLVIGSWTGTVGSGGVGSTNSDGYRSVAIASASGSQALDSISSITAQSSDYAQNAFWNRGYLRQLIALPSSGVAAKIGAGYSSSEAIELSGSIVPSFGRSGTASLYDLGTSDYKFRSLYAGSNGSLAVVASGSIGPEVDNAFDLGGLGSFSTSPSFSVGGSQSISASGITPSGGSEDTYPANLTVSSLSSAAAAAMTEGAVIKLSGGGKTVKLTIASAPSSGATTVSISAVELVQGSYPANTSDMYETPQLAKFSEWRNLYVDGVSYMDEVQLDNISEPSDVSNKLYSVSSILHWNGAPLGVPVVYRHTMTSSDISSDSRRYTMTSSDRTGDSDVVFSSSTVLNKVQVYLNGQLQFINASGDVNLTSTSLQLDFLASGALKADDIIQVIVFA